MCRCRNMGELKSPGNFWATAKVFSRIARQPCVIEFSLRALFSFVGIYLLVDHHTRASCHDGPLAPATADDPPAPPSQFLRMYSPTTFPFLTAHPCPKPSEDLLPRSTEKSGVTERAPSACSSEGGPSESCGPGLQRKSQRELETVSQGAAVAGARRFAGLFGGRGGQFSGGRGP